MLPIRRARPPRYLTKWNANKKRSPQIECNSRFRAFESHLLRMNPEYQKQGSGPAFVYVAGAEGTGRLFYKQAADLERDHTVITFPLRAHGRYAMSDLIDDLLWIVRDAGFERATFLGES